MQCNYINAVMFYFTGIRKKIAAKGKTKACEGLSLWAKSISHHVYWAACSSKGEGQLVTDQWLSITKHVANIHEGHRRQFPNCVHDEIGPDKREWLVKGSYNNPMLVG